MTDIDAIRARHVPEPGGWCRHDLKMQHEGDSAFTRSRTCEVAIVLAALDAANEQARLAHIDWAITASELTAAIEREARLRAALDPDAIRDEVRAAVLEGNSQDCSSADCIADAVYEIIRAALATTPEGEHG